MLVIADASRPVVIAGDHGRREFRGFAPDTTDLVLECAIFRPGSIRWTSRHTSASPPIPPTATSAGSTRTWRGEAAARALDLIVATAGGRVGGPRFAVGGDVPWQREIVAHDGLRARAAGLRHSRGRDEGGAGGARTHDRRARRPRPGRGTAWTVSIPSWRGDLDRPIDLVEEILRLHGTDRIPPARVAPPPSPATTTRSSASTAARPTTWSGTISTSARTSPCAPAREVAAWVSDAAAQELALANPFVEDQSHLRPTLVIGLLESLRLNQSRGVAASRLAETGRIFIERDGHVTRVRGGRLHRGGRRRAALAAARARRFLRGQAPRRPPWRRWPGSISRAEPIDPAPAGDRAWQEGHAAAGGLDRGRLDRRASACSTSRCCARSASRGRSTPASSRSCRSA